MPRFFFRLFFVQYIVLSTAETRLSFHVYYPHILSIESKARHVTLLTLASVPCALTDLSPWETSSRTYSRAFLARKRWGFLWWALMLQGKQPSCINWSLERSSPPSPPSVQTGYTVYCVRYHCIFHPLLKCRNISENCLVVDKMFLFHWDITYFWLCI